MQAITWDVLQRALDLQMLHPLSYWDAAILAAAEQSGCTLLLSEDLSDGGRYGALEVRNPLAVAGFRLQNQRKPAAFPYRNPGQASG